MFTTHSVYPPTFFSPDTVFHHDMENPHILSTTQKNPFVNMYQLLLLLVRWGTEGKDKEDGKPLDWGGKDKAEKERLKGFSVYC